MGNIIPLLVIVLIFGTIIWYLIHSIRTKGTICTSCDTCPTVDACDPEQITNDLRELIKG